MQGCARDNGFEPALLSPRLCCAAAFAQTAGIEIPVVRMRLDEGGSVPQDVVTVAVRIVNYSQSEFRFDVRPRPVELRQLPGGDS